VASRSTLSPCSAIHNHLLVNPTKSRLNTGCRGPQLCLSWPASDCRDPKASDEEEYLENLFDVLCSCLMQPFSRTAFFEAEGASLADRVSPVVMLAQAQTSAQSCTHPHQTLIPVHLALLEEVGDDGGCSHPGSESKICAARAP